MAYVIMIPAHFSRFPLGQPPTQQLRVFRSRISTTLMKNNLIFQLVATVPAAIMEINVACDVFRAMI